MFLYSVLTYLWLIPEAFMMNRHVVQKKLVQYAIPFMMKYATGQWVEHCSTTILFLFPTWVEFEFEFCLQFVEENEQDQALLKLETHRYFQGSHDGYWYTDNFEELAATTGYTDLLVCVTKYRAGLDLWINSVIMMSGTALGLLNYVSWCLWAFRQYNTLVHIRAGVPLSHALAPAPPTSPRAGGILSAPAFAPTPRAMPPPTPPFCQAFQWMLTRPLCACHPTPVSAAEQLDLA
jgi:hypothetical protein